MSRTQIDQFIDDEEEELCPLCVEEFDLSDKNFRPCPCGYQICQFCYNNIKTTMNGLCPACRRPYDEKSIEWKVISPEEMANYKADLAQQAKKKAAARQKEAQKREADSLSRKHLAGLRVVQKNLVYVTGLNPTTREDKLLETLRGDQYFGQYGKIVKIVVSKAKDTSHPQQSVGVYVTFARKEDAATCIAAVDGSINGDRTLRAQYGTTKYCSAYLRNEQCNNRNCMFLHEPGEENDSFTRQDLSSMNVISTQAPSQSHHSSSTSRHTPQPQPPPQQAPQAVAAAAQPMGRMDSHDGNASPTHDGPALPSTASWANKPPPTPQAQKASPTNLTASPALQAPTPAEASQTKQSGKKAKAKEQPPKPEEPKPVEKTPTPPPQPAPQRKPTHPLDEVLKNLSGDGLKFVFSSATLSPEDLKVVMNFPPLFDLKGGERRRLLREKEAEERQRTEAENQAIREAAVAQEQEEQPEGGSGSLQLGGEPEERTDMGQRQQHAIQPPSQQSIGGAVGLGQNFPFSEDMANLGLNNRGLTTQQQQQILLQQFKSASTQNSSLFQTAQPQMQSGMQNAANHARHTSRFTFGTDSNTATANVKPVANAKLMNQQASMMPHNNHFSQLSQHQPLGNQFYTSSVQGPPPGLKTTGTPPISGGGMFGQGHGFATGGLGYGANAVGRTANDDVMRDLLRGRGGNAGGSQVHDSGKLGDQDPLSQSVDALVGENDMASIQPAELAYILGQPRRATPTIPPGFSAPSSRLGTPGGSRLGTPVTGSVRPALPPGLPPPQHTITPAVPDIHPASRSSTPKKTKKDSTSSKAIETRPEAGKTPTIAKPDLDKPTADSTESVEVTEDRDFELEGRIERKEGKGKTEGKAEGKSKSEGKGKAGEALSTKAENLPSKPSAKAEKSASKVTADTKVTPTPSTPSRGQESPEEKTEAKSSLSTAKRQHPGPLHIPKKEAIISDAPITADSEPAKNPRATSISASASSRPVTPTGVTGSPMKRTAPGIMRITNTPKTETPPVLSAAAAPPTIPTLAQIRSRQPSVASINQPGTPLSEFVSDAASMTSASMSRTNSPPPNSRVGSAPTRSKTKSQARKERQERARQMTEEELGDTNTPTEEPIKQEAIQSRKKKEKKAKAPKPGKTVESTPVDSSEGTPAVEKKVESPVIEVKEEPAPEVAQPVETPKPALTAAGIIAKLEVAGEISHDAVENIFKSYPSGPNDRQIALADVPNRDREYHMEDDMIKAVVESHQAQRLGGEDGRISSRILVTPTGTIMRGLSKEEEDRYLELEARLTSSRPPAKWTQTKDPPTLDLDKIMRGLNIKTVLESAEKLARQQAQQKVQAAAGTPASAHAARVYDEAANYNDEFIMPASPTTPSAPTAAAGSTPTATSLPSSAQAAAVVAAAAATAAAGPAPFGSRYVHLNGVELSDDTGAALGVEVAGKIAGAGGFGLGGRAGVSGLVDVERELNFEKQRANDLTKKLNAAVKRNRRMVASAGH